MEDREVGREDRWAKSRRPGKPEHGLGEGRGGRLAWSPVPRGEEPSGRPARPPHRAWAPASSLAFPFAPKKWNLLCSASPSCALSRCCLLLYPSSRLTGGSERTAEITVWETRRRPPPRPLLPTPPPWPLTASTLFSPADVALYGGREARERPEGGGDREPLVRHHGVLTLEVRVWERRAPGGRAPRRTPALPALGPRPPARLPSPAHPARTLYSDEEIRLQTRAGGRLC